MRSLRTITLLLLVGIFLLPLPISVWARGEKVPEKWVELVKELKDTDTEDWLQALGALRKNPPMARKAFLKVLKGKPEDEMRWRYFHHFSEFGRAEDIPILLGFINGKETGEERRVIQGSARGLYRISGAKEDLLHLVGDFSYSPVRGGRSHTKGSGGDLLIDDAVIEAMHGEGLGLDLINKVNRLKGRSYDNKEDLQKILKKILSRKEFEKYANQLVDLVHPAPPLQKETGIIRVSLRNPIRKPILVELVFHIWWGRFAPPLEPLMVYLKKNGQGRFNIPVTLLRQPNVPTVKIHLRMKETNGDEILVEQKLYLSQS